MKCPTSDLASDLACLWLCGSILNILIHRWGGPAKGGYAWPLPRPLTAQQLLYSRKKCSNNNVEIHKNDVTQVTQVCSYFCVSTEPGYDSARPGLLPGFNVE